MDRKEGLPVSGRPPYFIHGGFGMAAPPQCLSPFMPLPVQSPNSSEGLSGDSTYHEDSPPFPGYGGGGCGVDVPQGGESMSKKREKPRKYEPEGNALPVVGESGTQKRRRGRPPGTGLKQQLSSYGEWFSSSAGMGFIPHAIEISKGEDMAAKIMSFSQQGPRAVCILSASGVVSSATLRQPDTSGGTMTYEGRFEILSLSGSYFLSDYGGSRSRAGGLSIQLTSPDGRVIGGAVGGQLIAASPVQVMVGSFIYGGNKVKSKPKSKPVPDLSWDSEQGPAPISLEEDTVPLDVAWPLLTGIERTGAGLIDINQSRS